MNEQELKKAVRQSLSGMDFADARKQQVILQSKGAKPMKKKLALVCAVVILTLLMGTALAAVLGVFGRMYASPQDAQKLAHLDQAAVVMDLTVPLEAPGSETAAPALTTCDEILLRQQERSFELTLNQTYYDGRKLYCSYTLKTNGAQRWQGEGLPTGVTEWLMEQPGKRYEEMWASNVPGRDEQITSWLGSHESSWIAFESWSLGDGARTADGVVLDIIGGGSERLDECTLQGWQEMEVPAELAQQETLTIELSVLYGASLYHQDETGVRWAHIAQPENRGILHIPFTVTKNGQTRHLQGEARFAAYAVKAGLTISDVEISGKAILKAPAEWTDLLTGRIENAHAGDFILNYLLMADGQMLPNHGGSLNAPMDGRIEIVLAYDLPKSMHELVLVPEYAKGGAKPEEGILLYDSAGERPPEAVRMP